MMIEQLSGILPCWVCRTADALGSEGTQKGSEKSEPFLFQPHLFKPTSTLLQIILIKIPLIQPPLLTY